MPFPRALDVEGGRLEEIGGRWGLSRERARQVEAKTKHFLRSYLESVDIDVPRAA